MFYKALLCKIGHCLEELLEFLRISELQMPNAGGLLEDNRKNPFGMSLSAKMANRN